MRLHSIPLSNSIPLLVSKPASERGERGGRESPAMACADELAEERRRAQFDVDAMKVEWAGSRRALAAAERIARLVAGDPVLRKDDKVMLSRKEMYKKTLHKAAHTIRLIRELELTEEETALLRFFVDEPNYFEMHVGMFIPAIKEQGTEEQRQKWLPLADSMQIIGSYAQTELGHGSNVRGLETTATFDRNAREFVIHSPTLSSTKWWPAGAGKTATHAVVYARLLTDGKDYGIHGFIVQLRSLEDHRPLPGITVGDIGSKFGIGSYNTMDNGFIRFDNVRIPRNQMLMRLAQVTDDGKYAETGVPRQLLYGTMVSVREYIVSNASRMLARAVCIAVRYSAVRRQFDSNDSGIETKVLDYRTQQDRLFPLLASAYAFKFAGRWLSWLYADTTRRLSDGDFSTLQEVHACTAGLKSLTTTATADGIEDCRKLCGGHGYLCSSGLPELFATYVPACTYEGDNVVLLLQVGKILVKTLRQLSQGQQPGGTTAYMGNMLSLMRWECDVRAPEDWLRPSALHQAFESRALRLAVNCSRNIDAAPSHEEGHQEFAADLVGAAVAHCQLIVVTKFMERLQQGIDGRGVEEQLRCLCGIYALSLLRKHQGDFLYTGCITPEQCTLANEQLRRLYTQVRDNAVALVDAFGYTDHYLGSALGRYDGEVYRALYEDARKDPLNYSDVPDGYKEYIRPLLRQELGVSRL